VLLLAALPVFCQSPENPKLQQLLRFTLNESPETVLKLLGNPTHIDDSLRGYQSWQYEFGADEQSDDNSPPAWYVCVNTSTRQVVSITRNFDKPQDVDELFPGVESYHWPSKAVPQFSVRLRTLAGEAILLAMGTSKRGERTSQLMMIRRSALRTFMPWLAEQFR
jgi:hypothetical protein